MHLDLWLQHVLGDQEVCIHLVCKLVFCKHGGHNLVCNAVATFLDGRLHLLAERGMRASKRAFKNFVRKTKLMDWPRVLCRAFSKKRIRNLSVMGLTRAILIAIVAMSSFNKADDVCNSTFDDVGAGQSDGEYPGLPRYSRCARKSTWIESAKSLLRRTEDLLEDGEGVGLDLH